MCPTFSSLCSVVYNYTMHYVLVSLKNGKLYIGYTSDLKKRFKSHNEGLSSYTSKYRPWKLVYYEAYASKADAQDRERNLKKYTNGFGILKKRILRSLENVG